jgi:NADH dehydrogenase FAD-containing subunit
LQRDFTKPGGRECKRAALKVWGGGPQESLPKGSQEKPQGLVVDGHLRVAGSRGTILALGDCAVVEQQKALEYVMQLFKVTALLTKVSACSSSPNTG